jgi:hypothetical protein
MENELSPLLGVTALCFGDIRGEFLYFDDHFALMMIYFASFIRYKGEAGCAPSRLKALSKFEERKVTRGHYT